MRMIEAAFAGASERPTVDERNTLVLEHTGLVRALASRVARRVPAQFDVSELVSVGMLGLIDAAGRYRPSLGVPFEAYARRRVEGAMLDLLRQLDAVPRSVRKLRRDVDATVTRLRHELKREPNDAEIARGLGVSDEEYIRTLRHLGTADIGFVRQVDNTDSSETSILDLAVDPEDGPQVRLERAELKQRLAEAITELPERERQILTLYYHEELTLAEIGAVIGVGESRVSQLRTQAITRLRARLRETLRLTDLR